jgi:hypothetical protein
MARLFLTSIIARSSLGREKRVSAPAIRLEFDNKA